MTLTEVLQKGFIVRHHNINEKISMKDVVLVYKGIRPAKMDKELFKAISKELNKLLKEYKKGEMFHLSKMTNSLWENLGGLKHKQRGSTFKGSVHDKNKRNNKRTK
jgi:pantothenate kinase